MSDPNPPSKMPPTLDFSLSGVKPWWQSATIVAALVMIVIRIGSHFGLGGDEFERWVSSVIGDIVTVILPGLVAIWGRLRAQHTINPPLAVPPLTSRTPGFLLAVTSGVLVAALALGTAVGASVVGGCNETPVTRAYKSTQIVTSAQDALAAALDEKLVSSRQAKELLPYLEAVRAANRVYASAALSGDVNAIETARDSLAAALAAYQTRYAAALIPPLTPASTLPTTLPAGG